MDFFTGCLTREESDQFIDRAESDIENYGYGLFCRRVQGNRRIHRVHRPAYGQRFQAHFHPCGGNWLAYRRAVLEKGPGDRGIAWRD